MKSIRKFLQLSPVERRIFLRELRILSLIAWALRLLDFDRCKALLIRQVSRYSMKSAGILKNDLAEARQERGVQHAKRTSRTKWPLCGFLGSTDGGVKMSLRK